MDGLEVMTWGTVGAGIVAGASLGVNAMRGVRRLRQRELELLQRVDRVPDEVTFSVPPFSFGRRALIRHLILRGEHELAAGLLDGHVRTVSVAAALGHAGPGAQEVVRTYSCRGCAAKGHGADHLGSTLSLVHGRGPGAAPTGVRCARGHELLDPALLRN